jgi:hypothetical protein
VPPTAGIPRGLPGPPDGGEPVAWYRPTRTSNLQVGAAAMAVVFLGVVFFDRGSLTTWVPYAYIAGVGVFFYFAIGSVTLTVSPDWLCHKHGFATDWVTFGELSRVTLVSGPTGFHTLELSSDQRKVSVHLSELREQDDVYDLTLQGIRQARQEGGVQVDDKTRNILDGTAVYH